MPSAEVLALVTLKGRIWKHLHDVFVRLPLDHFYRWTPRGDGTVTEGLTEADRVVPLGFIANELASSYDGGKNRREASQEQIGTDWAVTLEFPQQVLSEMMNAKLAKRVNMFIPASATTPSVSLILGRVDFIHPPSADPTHGSILKYTFSALIGRT